MERGSSALACVLLVASAHTARAGINVWTDRGPEGLWVVAIAIAPTTPSTLCAITEDGLFKTIDGGTWHGANAGLPDFDVTGATAPAIDPFTPTTLYAGTFRGVFKSTDASSRP